MNLKQILALVCDLAELSELSVKDCAIRLHCLFELIQAGRYRATLDPPFTQAILRTGNTGSILVLDLSVAADTNQFSVVQKLLGEPKDIQIVSPPIADPTSPEASPAWEYKYAYGYELNAREVWFGIEKFREEERLVSISIHHTFDE